MIEIHVTAELLAASRDGRVPTEVVIEILARHLVQRCEVCREQALLALDLLREEAGSSGDWPALPAGVAPELHGARESGKLDGQVHQLAQRWREEEAAAQRDMEALLDLEPEQRAGQIHGSQDRFRSLELARRLLRRSIDGGAEGPEAMERWASLAERVARRASAEGQEEQRQRGELIGRAIAWQANGLRRAEKMTQALDLLDTARQVYLDEGVTDALAIAELERIQGAALRDLRAPQSTAVLLTAVQLHQIADDPEGEARAWLALGLSYRNQGQLEEAVQTADAALKVMPETAPERLRLTAWHNRASYLTSLERIDEARYAYARAGDLYSTQPDTETRLEQQWLRSQMLLVEGRTTEALKILEQVARDLRAIGADLRAAVAELEIVEVLLTNNEPLAGHGRASQLLMRRELYLQLPLAATPILITLSDAVDRKQLSASLVRQLKEELSETGCS